MSEAPSETQAEQEMSECELEALKLRIDALLQTEKKQYESDEVFELVNLWYRNGQVRSAQSLTIRKIQVAHDGKASLTVFNRTLVAINFALGTAMLLFLFSAAGLSMSVKGLVQPFIILASGCYLIAFLCQYPQHRITVDPRNGTLRLRKRFILQYSDRVIPLNVIRLAYAVMTRDRGKYSQEKECFAICLVIEPLGIGYRLATRKWLYECEEYAEQLPVAFRMLKWSDNTFKVDRFWC